jgi:uncharacterized protein
MNEVDGDEHVPPVLNEAAQPTRDADRIDSLDTLRGFALLGILVMNIQSFAMPSSAYFTPTSYGSFEGVNQVVWYIGNLFFDLKFMAMFSMMFGAGIVLMSRGRDAQGKPVLATHYRRMFILLIFGLVHAYCIWYGDILVPYAICGMFVVWVRNWSPRGLAVTGACLIVFGSLFHLFIGLGASVSSDFADGMRSSMEPTEEALQGEVATYRGSWSGQMTTRALAVASMHFFVVPASYFWRISGLMLLGMALFKRGVMNAERSNRFYWTMVVLGGGIGFPLVAFGAYWSTTVGFDTTHMLGFGALPNWYGSVGVALMWMALVMLLCKSDSFCRVKFVLSCYGRMAFTNYIGQTVLATFFFYGYGLGQFGYLDRFEQVGVVVAIWAIQLTLSPIWLKYFQFGPLEWVWRSGVYARLQPMFRLRSQSPLG